MDEQKFLCDGDILIVKDGTFSVNSDEFDHINIEKIKKVILPEGIREIGEIAFADFTNLQEINIPASVKKIGRVAFAGCSSLERIKIPEGIERICHKTFDECINLSEVILPSTLKEIGAYAFSRCKNLNNLKIPSNVVNILERAFEYSGLKSIVIPQNVTEIMQDTFTGCIHLSSVTLPESLRKIGRNAFSNCIDLRRITIPDNAEITIRAFLGTKDLTIDYKGKRFPGLFFSNLKIIRFIDKPDINHLTEIENMQDKIRLAFMYMNDDPKIKTYLRKQSVKAIDYIVETQDIEMLDKLLSSDIISKRTIDKCLDKVRINEFHEAFIILNQYKHEHFKRKDNEIEKRFDL